jgi:hypothetical protein
MMEAASSSETLVLTRATRRNIPENGILHSQRRDNLHSYIVSRMWFFGVCHPVVTAVKNPNLT